MALPEVYASFANPNNLLLGGEAQGRGGAAAAIWTDASAIAFYNPAAGAHVERGELSASFTLYTKYDTVFATGSDLFNSAARANRGFFRSLPTATGSVFKRNKWSYGFSILLTDFNTFDGNIAGAEDIITNLRVTDESLWSGGHLSWMISPNESLGVALFYTARNYSHSLFDQSFASPSEATIYSSEKSYYYNSLVLQLGYLVRWSKWSLGVSYRAPAFRLSGRGSFQQAETQTSPFQQELTEDTDVSSSGATPQHIRWGVAWRPTEQTSWSADIQWSQYLRQRDLDSQSGGDEIIYHPTFNFSLGAEFTLLENLKLRAGGFTNFSNHRRASQPERRVADHVDQLGFSGNLGLRTKENVEFTFGGYYTGGKGESWQRTASGLKVYPKNQRIFSLLVGSAYTF